MPCWNEHPRICQTAKFCENMRMSKFRNKHILLKCFGARTCCKLLSYFRLTPLNLANCNISWKNEKPKILTKNAYLDIFLAGISKQYCHIWNQHPQVCLIAKFGEKIKMSKFGTKNALFWCFWTEIWKQCLQISNYHPQICLIVKSSENMRICKFGTKILIFVFLGSNFKKLLSYLKLAPFYLLNWEI